MLLCKMTLEQVPMQLSGARLLPWSLAPEKSHSDLELLGSSLGGGCREPDC